MNESPPVGCTFWEDVKSTAHNAFVGIEHLNPATIAAGVTALNARLVAAEQVVATALPAITNFIERVSPAIIALSTLIPNGAEIPEEVALLEAEMAKVMAVLMPIVAAQAEKAKE